jgi:hypothetical protein
MAVKRGILFLVGTALLAMVVLFLLGSPASKPALAPIETLFPTRPTEQIAALSIHVGQTQRWQYVRAKGEWRSIEAHGALVHTPSLEALFAASLEARGPLVHQGLPLPAILGFQDPSRWRLEFHGPKLFSREDRHVLLAVELGKSFPDGPWGHAYARNLAAPERVLDIDSNLEQLCSASDQRLPPLVDPRIGAGCFSPAFRTFKRYFLDYADGASFEIASSPRPSEPELQDWTLIQGERRETAIEWRAGGYGGIWIRAHAIGYASKKRLAELGLEKPKLQLTLEPDAGPLLSIRIAALNSAREAWIYNETSDVVMQVEAEVLEQMLAQPWQFTDKNQPNPFERWLRR